MWSTVKNNSTRIREFCHWFPPVCHGSVTELGYVTGSIATVTVSSRPVTASSGSAPACHHQREYKAGGDRRALLPPRWQKKQIWTANHKRSYFEIHYLPNHRSDRIRTLTIEISISNLVEFQKISFSGSTQKSSGCTDAREVTVLTLTAIFTLPHQAVILTIAAHRSTMSGKASLEISQESVLQQGKVIFGPTQEHPWWLLPDKCTEKKSTPSCRLLQIESGVYRGHFSHQTLSKYLWKEE